MLVGEPQKEKRSSEDETVELLKTLKRSEYSVLEQLKKLSVQISILSFMLSSEAHRNALVKILNESHILRGIATKDFKQIV